MQPIRFNKAGKFMLNKYVDGKPRKSATTSIFRNGVVQSVTPNININGSPIEDGNSLWPAANPDTSIEASIAVQLGYMPPDLYAFIMGDKTEELSNALFPVIDEEIIVPDVEPFEVTLKHKPVGDVIVVDTSNKPFTKVTEDETTPSAGEYTINDDKLSFSQEDAGKSLFISYDYTATTVNKFGLPKTPVRETYQLIIAGEAVGEDESLYEVALTVDKCKVTGSINPPAQGGTPQPVTITFTVLKPRGNLRAVDYMATPLTTTTQS